MNFLEWQYLYPPRPENAILPGMVGFYEKRGWVAQIKCNGTANIFGSNGTTFKAMNRHNEDHKAWAPSSATSDLLVRASKGKWLVVVAELMHNKVPGIKNVNYINDILVYEGKLLYETTFAERLKLLDKIFLPFKTGEQQFYHELGPHWWLAKTLTTNFKQTFDGLVKPEHEGLVFKDPAAKLKMCSRPAANVSWQIKVRHPTKNYGF